MRQKIHYLIKENLTRNAKGYILVTGVFLAGVFLSFVLQISSSSEEEIKLYMNDFLSNVNSYSIDPVKTFQLSMIGNAKLTFVLLIMSLTLIGGVGTLACVFFKGFSYGTVICALFNTLGAKSAFLFCCVVLPHTVISAMCFATYSVFSLKNTVAINKGVKNVKKNIILSLVYACFNLFVLCIPAVIQAYIEPILLRVFLF